MKDKELTIHLMLLKEQILAELRSELSGLLRAEKQIEEHKVREPLVAKIRPRDSLQDEDFNKPRPKLDQEDIDFQNRLHQEPQRRRSPPKERPQARTSKAKASKAKLQSAKKPLIVLDYQNIAMRHGNNEFFSCKGIKLAIDYWKNEGHEVIGFIPDYVMDRKKI